MSLQLTHEAGACFDGVPRCLNRKLFEILLHEDAAHHQKELRRTNGSKYDHRTHMHDSIAFELHRYLKYAGL
jgi:hypothetical protein